MIGNHIILFTGLGKCPELGVLDLDMRAYAAKLWGGGSGIIREVTAAINAQWATCISSCNRVTLSWEVLYNYNKLMVIMVMPVYARCLIRDDISTSGLE